MSKRSKRSVDYLLVVVLASLLLIGFVALFSASAQLSKERGEGVFFYLKHQAWAGLLPGLLLGVLVFLVDTERLKKWSLYLLLGNVVLVALVFVPGLGLRLSGARRWLAFGSFTFQPSELLKVTLPLYLAVWLEKQKDRGWLTLVFFIGILSLVSLSTIAQPDTSTTIILIVYALLVYLLSEAPPAHLIVLLFLVATGLTVLIYLSPYRMSRIISVFNPAYQLQGVGYQAKQSRIAIGSGGIWGKGLGLSSQKFGFLPNVVSDSIFAAWAEETGLAGSLLLIFLFLLFLIRSIMVAYRRSDRFARTLGPALAGGIVFQALFNIGAMAGVLPLTGVPLPFMSYGGSHLLAELVTVGLIFNLYKKS